MEYRELGKLKGDNNPAISPVLVLENALGTVIKFLFNFAGITT